MAHSIEPQDRAKAEWRVFAPFELFERGGPNKVQDTHARTS
jgi:hypothetical protein